MTRMPALLTLILLAMASQAQAGRFDPHQAGYTLYRGKSVLGEASVQLEAADSPDCYVYSYTARPSWLFRWATGNITERSEFCVENGRLKPTAYRYHRSGIGADDENFSLSFDAQRQIVTDHTGAEREWPQGAVDRMGVQLEALRLVEGMSIPVEERRLTVTIVDDDRIKDYTLAVVGSETIEVPAGRFETIRIERINDPRKTTRFWVAPALDNLLVKVEQQRKDDPVIGIALKSPPQTPAPEPAPSPTP